MAKIKNRSSVPTIPIQWRSGKSHLVEWRTAHEPFEQWVQKVTNYATANGLDIPTADQLDELACTQFPKYVCTQDSYHAPAMRRSTGGCSSCGGRK